MSTHERSPGVIGLLRDPLRTLRKARRRKLDCRQFLNCPEMLEPELRASEIKRLIFYNHYHNGDIHFSREIVAGILKLLPSVPCVYSHACPPDLLADLPALTHDAALLKGLPRNSPYVVDKLSKTVFINTWIGCLGQDVVQECRGINITLLHNIIRASLARATGLCAPELAQCAPNPDFTRFYVMNIDAFVRSDTRTRVLISNGKVLSAQSADFDFTPLIESLASKHRDILFIPTNPTPLRQANIIHSADIIRKNGPDLNENGYLSTFCSAIIGKSSGTYSFSINRVNLQSPKVFLSFVNHPVEASLGFDEPVFNSHCTFIATNDFRPVAVRRNMARAVQLATDPKFQTARVAFGTAD